MNPSEHPSLASRIAAARAKLQTVPVSKLTATAFCSGVFGSLLLGVLPDLFQGHLSRSTATAFQRLEPGIAEIAKIPPGGQRVISVAPGQPLMAFLHLESGGSLILGSRGVPEGKSSKRFTAGGSLTGELPAALVAITPQAPLRLYNGSDQRAEVYISASAQD